ncbi:PcfJ domain-containing protein [Pectinatus haikarae]|uniref:PcfJ domain-containing protein n=1 Tax=Pectinatus haikarae TaxID=349096 RepID=UPI0018C6E473|nr:PcfJ domain-containing protein [Pectinatus haikarae]
MNGIANQMKQQLEVLDDLKKLQDEAEKEKLFGNSTNEEHKMIPFDIDNPLCRRLAMQSDRIKFFLPGTSFDLYTAGKKLKNCVGAYVDEVKNKETQIVLVSDDKGKLVVCIEVKNNKVEQAKLFANKCVSTDPLLNAEVIDWAEKAKIDWQGCSDIKQRDNYLMPLPAAV